MDIQLQCYLLHNISFYFTLYSLMPCLKYLSVRYSTQWFFYSNKSQYSIYNQRFLKSFEYSLSQCNSYEKHGQKPIFAGKSEKLEGWGFLAWVGRVTRNTNIFSPPYSWLLGTLCGLCHTILDLRNGSPTKFAACHSGKNGNIFYITSMRIDNNFQSYNVKGTLRWVLLIKIQPIFGLVNSIPVYTYVW